MSNLFGRTVIYSDVSEITVGNVLEVLEKAMPVHLKNSRDIDYLEKYYRGKQPVLDRTKEYNKNILNKIVENRANEIVDFKSGYLMGEPVQYVARGEANADGITILNNYVFAEDKEFEDYNLADWFHICGTSYRMVLAESDREDPADAPFSLYTLDPRNTFVIYSSGVGNKPLAGVNYVAQQDGKVIFSVYTPTLCITCDSQGSMGGASVMSVSAPNYVGETVEHGYGTVPIIEYPANRARLGAFEIVIDLLDAMNDLSSNREDAIEQFIQALLIIKGVDFDEENWFDKLKEEGALLMPENGDAKYLASELNQMQTQALAEWMYQTVLTICGMPNRNGGTSTSDTGQAVVLRDGWSAAETRAKTSERMFKRSEKQFLKLIIEFVNTYRGLDLKLSDIEIRFTRRNYENITAKAQVLVSLLNCKKVHPRLAFAHSGMFVDPELAYAMSEAWIAEQIKQEAESLNDLSEDD